MALVSPLSHSLSLSNSATQTRTAIRASSATQSIALNNASLTVLAGACRATMARKGSVCQRQVANPQYASKENQERFVKAHATLRLGSAKMWLAPIPASFPPSPATKTKTAGKANTASSCATKDAQTRAHTVVQRKILRPNAQGQNAQACVWITPPSQSPAIRMQIANKVRNACQLCVL